MILTEELLGGLDLLYVGHFFNGGRGETEWRWLKEETETGRKIVGACRVHFKLRLRYRPGYSHPPGAALICYTRQKIKNNITCVDVR